MAVGDRNALTSTVGMGLSVLWLPMMAMAVLRAVLRSKVGPACVQDLFYGRVLLILAFSI